MSKSKTNTLANRRNPKCRQCRHPIPISAKICSTCKSYQDWRGSLPITSTALAVLTAMISVVSLAVPSFINAFHRPRSNAYLTMPSFDGTNLRIIAINSGDAPASLLPAHVQGTFLAGATRVRLKNEEAAFVKPGAQQIVFDIVPPLSSSQAYKASLDILVDLMPDTKGNPSPEKTVENIVVGVMQSNGHYSVHNIPIFADDMFQLLRNHSDRCESEQHPSFENGCIGNGSD
jgi:RNA polymerase subunit RPABC4/transcription elongation factor Spt4